MNNFAELHNLYGLALQFGGKLVEDCTIMEKGDAHSTKFGFN